MPDPAEAVARALGVPVTATAPLAGGCIADARRVTLEGGRDVFAKTLPGGGGAFGVEAAGLRALAEVAGRLDPADRIHAPAVLHEAHDLLILEWLDIDPAATTDGADWGRRLAAFHRAGVGEAGGGFGWPTAGTLGTTPQDNRDAPDWPTFWRDRRLLPMLAALDAADRGAGVTDDGRRLADRLPRLLAGADPTPTLLHGDLWAGNYATLAGGSGGGPTWFDPACYLGSREAEFGMTRMFGRFGDAFEHAYDAAYPLPPGFPRRADAYELHHHLNHLLLFGDTYRPGCRRLLDRLLGRG